jgi:hypothetical protein
VRVSPEDRQRFHRQGAALAAAATEARPSPEVRSARRARADRRRALLGLPPLCDDLAEVPEMGLFTRAERLGLLRRRG